VWPLRAGAQQSWQIGFLGMASHSEHARRLDALRTGLRQLGYEEGKNIVIHYRWAEGRYDRLPGLAAELVKLNVDVVMTHTTAGARAAKQATSSIPIIAFSIADPVDVGLVASLARPGGNLTGLTFFFAELCAKRVELIKEAIPKLSRVAVFFNPANPSHNLAQPAMQRTAGSLGLELVLIEVKARDDIAAAIATVTARQAQALTIIEEPIFVAKAREIGGLALQNRLPVIGYNPYAEAGALLEYGVNLEDLSFRSAAFVDKILKGASPADLPVERAIKFDLIINLKSAKALDIELPTSLLIRASGVIE
jgi:putative tryptophan/tyrosine transport system substrate-binding protein